MNSISAERDQRKRAVAEEVFRGMDLNGDGKSVFFYFALFVLFLFRSFVAQLAVVQI